MNIMDFSYNGILASSFGISGSPTIPMLPERRRVKMDIVGRDGSYDFGLESYAPRPIFMDCTIEATSQDDLMDRLTLAAAWLSGAGYLICGRSPTKRWKAKVFSSIEPDLAAKAGGFRIVFEADPPFAEDVDAQSGSIGSAHDYGSVRQFAPVITATITTAATWLQVLHLATGRFVRVEDTLVVGNAIAIDMARGKVTRSGVSIMTKVRIDSLFFLVPSGSQTITLTTDGAATAVMSYRREYPYA